MVRLGFAVSVASFLHPIIFVSLYFSIHFRKMLFQSLWKRPKLTPFRHTLDCNLIFWDGRIVEDAKKPKISHTQITSRFGHFFRRNCGLRIHERNKVELWVKSLEVVDIGATLTDFEQILTDIADRLWVRPWVTFQTFRSFQIGLRLGFLRSSGIF